MELRLRRAFRSELIDGGDLHQSSGADRIAEGLTNTLFTIGRRRPPPATLEAAYHKADLAIQNLIDLLAA